MQTELKYKVRYVWSEADKKGVPPEELGTICELSRMVRKGCKVKDFNEKLKML